jgi:tetratricopeptide (TPR) repeat protein
MARESLRIGENRDEVCHLANAVLGDIAMFRGDIDETLARYAAATNGFARDIVALAPYGSAMTALAMVYGGRGTDAAAIAAASILDADTGGCATVRAFARYAAAEAQVGEDPQRASALLSEAIAIASSCGSAFIAGLARLTLATLTARQGDPSRALAHYPELLREWRRSGVWAQQWNTLRTLVPILAATGRHTGACTLLGALTANGQAEAWGADEDEIVATERRLRAELGSDYAVAFEDGAVLNPAQTVQFALELTTT